MNSESDSLEQDAPKQIDVKSILEALQGLRFGTVSIIVQDGVIVQIDRTEKTRLRRPTENHDSGPKPPIRRH